MTGDGVGWLKLSRLKKLMEDENYRNMILAKLNKSIDKKVAPDDHIQDVVSIVTVDTCLMFSISVPQEICLQRNA